MDSIPNPAHSGLTNPPESAAFRTPNNKTQYYPFSRNGYASPAMVSRLASNNTGGQSRPPQPNADHSSAVARMPLTPHNQQPAAQPLSAAVASSPLSTTRGSNAYSTFTTPKNVLHRRATAAAAAAVAHQQQQSANSSFSSTASSASGNRFRFFQPVNQTPPSRAAQQQPVHNPFEEQLVSRLHLPLICSPSLFHRPSTPQLSSTQFEWTIDEVSALNPVNVEAHETQFHSVIDPEQEARAQAAISAFLEDKLTVPSPVDCPLRKQRIEALLPGGRARAAAAKKARRAARRKEKASLQQQQQQQAKEKVLTRAASCQTVLTLPPRLPDSLELLLRPFCTFTQDQQQDVQLQARGGDGNDADGAVEVEDGGAGGGSEESDEASDDDGEEYADYECEPEIDHDARDASLRRKLFNTSPLSERESDEFPPLMELVNMSPPPGSPELTKSSNLSRYVTASAASMAADAQHNHNQSHHSFRLSLSPVRAQVSGKLVADNGTPTSFGSLSPIRNTNSNCRQLSSPQRRRSSNAYRQAASSSANSDDGQAPGSRSLLGRTSRSRHSSSSFCQSTPGRNGSAGGNGTALGGSLENLTLNGGGDGSRSRSLSRSSRSRSRLAGRKLAASFGDTTSNVFDEMIGVNRVEDEDEPMLEATAPNVAKQRVARNGTDDVSMNGNATAKLDDTVEGDDNCENEDVLNCSSYSQTHDGTPNRKLTWAKGKNLSHSFEEEVEDEAASPVTRNQHKPEASGPESSCIFGKFKKVNSMAVDVECDKINQGKVLCQTDSGFNEGEL